MDFPTAETQFAISGPFVTLLVVIAAVWMIVMLFRVPRRRKTVGPNAVKICSECSAPNPPHARFCRNCGGGV